MWIAAAAAVLLLATVAYADVNETYTFNAADQLTAVSDAGGSIGDYAYDGDGERISKTVGTVTVIYVRDPAGNVLAEFDASTGDYIAEYIYVNGKKVCRVATDGTKTYFHHDHLGTPRAITDSNGQLLWDGEYLPFGAESSSSGSRDDSFHFTGHEFDGELDLYYMHARYYSPSLGRFLSVDPVGGDVGSSQSRNRYSYVLNNPLILVDPTGETFALPGDKKKRDHQLSFLRQVMGEAGNYLTAVEKDGRWELGLSGISASEFAKTGDAQHAMAYLMKAAHTFRMKFYKTNDHALYAGWSRTIFINEGSFPRFLHPKMAFAKINYENSIVVTAEEAFVHEMGHAISRIIPGVAERLQRESQGPPREGLSMALQNNYRFSRGDGPRLFYSRMGDYTLSDLPVRIFP